MRFDPRAWLIEHWPLKVVALLLALALWGTVAAKRPATQIRTVELQVELPNGRALTRQLPNVSALVVGRASGLLALYREPLRIHKVVPDTVSGAQFLLALAPADVVVSPSANVAVQDVQPRQILIVLDEVSRRHVPVRARVTIRPDSGYVLVGGIAVIPAEVEISGPRAVVEPTESVATSPVSVSGAREPIRLAVPIDTAALGTLRVSPSAVQVVAEVVPLAERLFSAIRVRVTDDAWAIDPAEVTLTVRGPATRVLALAADSFQVSVAPGRAASPGQSIPIVVESPPGISATPDPAAVVLQRRLR
jgi:hypothetical protein